MKEIKWNPTKSRRLKRTRGASFEEILASNLVDTCDHPNRSDQKVMLYKYKNYLWVVPFVETETEIFLKTLYPSRRYTKLYKGEIR